MKNKELNKQSFAEKLKQLMHSDRQFLAPGVNRDTVAAALGTNRTYLCYYIRETYGQSFPEYINTLRLEAALDMFNSGDYDIQGVAEAVGYTCYSSFYRAFMKRYGVKPTDFLNIEEKNSE